MQFGKPTDDSISEFVNGISRLEGFGALLGILSPTFNCIHFAFLRLGKSSITLSIRA
jgi:hypothetical protein